MEVIQIYKIYEISSSNKKYTRFIHFDISICQIHTFHILLSKLLWNSIKEFFCSCAIYFFSTHTWSKSEKYAKFFQYLSVIYPLEYFVISRLFLSQIIFFNICRQAIKQLIINMIDLNALFVLHFNCKEILLSIYTFQNLVF
jgi:hypothetical protein